MGPASLRCDGLGVGGGGGGVAAAYAPGVVIGFVKVAISVSETLDSAFSCVGACQECCQLVRLHSDLQRNLQGDIMIFWQA